MNFMYENSYLAVKSYIAGLYLLVIFALFTTP